LNQLLTLSETGGWLGQVVEILTLQALVYQVQGDSGRALAALERALTLAEPEGFMRTFIDEGAAMAKLLRLAQSREIKPNYVSKLLTAFSLEATSPLLAPIPASPLIEPLTERELELLRLVAVGHSNQQIAQELFLAVGTVKKHLNNIFGKLTVGNRTQAIARAQELDLL
jgi:LuxR family maltose regulon positive regulatory protein